MLMSETAGVGLPAAIEMCGGKRESFRTLKPSENVEVVSTTVTPGLQILADAEALTYMKVGDKF